MVDAVIGTWSGDIDLNGTPVPIVLHLSVRDSGLRASADFPKHYRTDVELLDVSFEHNALRFGTRNMGVFSGSLSDDASRIEGAFQNGAQRYALVLQPGEARRAESARPQTPKPPFNYQGIEVQVENARARCVLAGTFTRPASALRASVLLITGSGAMDRDETVFGHKPFLVLADHLSRAGYAVLRLDNRGVGASTGDRSSHTLADDVDDMAVAVDHLAQRDELRGLPIALIGHSVGALTAMQLAPTRPGIVGLISMAGPGLTVGEAFADRECERLRKSGTGQAEIERHREFTLALYGNIADRDHAPIDSAEITVLAERHGAADTAVVKNSADWIARFNEPWFRSLVRATPKVALQRVTTPFLAINGSRDTQVRSTTNLEAMSEILTAAKHADFSLVEMEGLNHLFQTCTTGLPYEYPSIEETFAPRALEVVRGWLDERFPIRR